MAGPQPNKPSNDNPNDHGNRDVAAINSRPRHEAHRPFSTSNQTDPLQTEATKATETGEQEHEAWANWVYPPEFYDRLSKVHLSHEALEEFDRRSRLTRHRPRHSHPYETASFLLYTESSKQGLARFARHGGPDLGDIYDCHPPKLPPANMLGENAPSLSKATTTSETKRKKSTPYNADFQQHLDDHHVQAIYNSQKPANWAEIQAALKQRRLSLTSSQFSDGAFDAFQDSNDRAENEDTVLVDVIPAILDKGTAGAGHQMLERNILFNNLAPLTDGTIAQPKPDIYFGTRPTELYHPVRNALGCYIMPSTTQNKALAPNFFVEVKGPDGSGAVALRQARYDGAVGSRAIHSLQNYGNEKAQYDSQAYTFSTIYNASAGSLQLYTHYIASPASEGGPPNYHMAQVRTFAMTNDRDTFVQGATAFRNARDMAKQHRDRFIKAANEVVKAACRSSPVRGNINAPPVAGNATNKLTKRRYLSLSEAVSDHPTGDSKRLRRSL